MSDETVKKIPVPGRSRGGQWVRIGDEEYRIPPLALNAVQEIEPQLEKLQIATTTNKERMAIISEVVGVAIRRNYPEISDDDVKDMLDVENYQRIFTVIMANSGFGNKGSSSGKASPSIGTTSTPA